jgi:hypothetical protein
MRAFHAILLALVIVGTATAQPVALELTTPKAHQVIQRRGFDPAVAAKQQPGHPSLGYADVVIQAEYPKGTAQGTWEYRYLLPDAVGKAVHWTYLHRPEIGIRWRVSRQVVGIGLRYAVATKIECLHKEQSSRLVWAKFLSSRVNRMRRIATMSV